MLKELKEFLAEFSFLRPSDVKALASVCRVQRFEKGTIILQAGASDYNMYLVVKGFTRTYVIREDGEERTVFLASAGMGCGSSKTIYKDQPSNENVVALENCVVLVWDFPEFKKACKNHPNLYRLYSNMLERSFIEAVERLEFHSVMNPDQRYEYLIEHRPELLEKVPLKFIASYIGITPVSLSRLRARLVGKSSKN